MVNDPATVFAYMKKMADEISSATRILHDLFRQGELEESQVDIFEQKCVDLLNKAKACHCLVSTDPHGAKRKLEADEQAYSDLAESGGIENAP